MNLPKAVELSYLTYLNLVDHLQIQATTDSWAEALLEQLQAEAKPVWENQLISPNNSQIKLIEPED